MSTEQTIPPYNGEVHYPHYFFTENYPRVVVYSLWGYERYTHLREESVGIITGVDLIAA